MLLPRVVLQRSWPAKCCPEPPCACCRKVKGEEGLPAAASDDEDEEEGGAPERRSMLNYAEYYPMLLPLRRPEDEGPGEELPGDEAAAGGEVDWDQLRVSEQAERAQRSNLRLQKAQKPSRTGL